MKEGSSGGASFCERFRQGDLGEVFFAGDPKKNEVSERDAECPLNGPPFP